MTNTIMNKFGSIVLITLMLLNTFAANAGVVLAANSPPVAGADSMTVTGGAATTINPLANDYDPDGNAINVKLVSNPLHGTATFTPSSVTYTPVAGYIGTDRFAYFVTDGTATAVGVISVTVSAANSAPDAVDDAIRTNENQAKTFNPMSNDADPNGDVMTIVGASGASHGTLAFTDTTITYTPANGYSGADSFTYTIVDGSLFDTATVTVTVTAVNQPPVAVDDSVTTPEDNAITFDPRANDSDPEGDAITIIGANGALNGVVTFTGTTVTYTPSANWFGSDALVYFIQDTSGAQAIGAVDITVTSVNDVPVANADSYSTPEDTPLVIAATGVLANDVDVEGDALAAVLDTTVSHGALTLNADGGFSYTPAADYNGADSFTYHANDGAANSNVATVTITVGPINDAPVAVADAYSTDEDTPLVVPAAGVLTNDTDAEGDPMTASLVAGPTNGALTLNADGSFSYTPNANWNGADSFTYQANDGLANSNVATVTITVNAVNDAPVAVNDAYSTDEDTPRVVAAAGVLINDTDVEGSALTAVLDTTTTNGVLALNADGGFTYTPNADFNGTDSFTYHANDGAANSNIATVTITVNAVDDVPVANNDSFTINEDATTDFDVLGNDTGLGDTPIVVTISSAPLFGTATINPDNTIHFVPNADYNGADTLDYTVTDADADTDVATVAITINAVNDAPVAVNDAYSTNEDTPLVVAAVGILANDTDVEGSALTAVLDTNVTHGALTLNADGGFSYTPNADFNGADTFTYRANDGAANSNIATVTITVNAQNDAPVVNVPLVDQTATTTVPFTYTFAANSFTDVDGDALSYGATLVGGAPLPAWLAFTAGTRTFNGTAAAPDVGTISVRVTASDGNGGSVTDDFDITVVLFNNAPVAVADSYSVAEDGTLNVAAAGVLTNDTDAEADPLTAALDVGPANGTLLFNANGSFSYTPDVDFFGADSFTYHANDGALDSNIATVSITVTPVNDAPVGVADSYTTAEDTPLVVAAPGVLTNDTDVEGDALTAVLVAGPTNGVLALNANGSFTYTPAANYNGADSFTYRANDGALNSGITTVSLTVTLVNDAPVAVADAYSTNEDTPLVVAAPGVLANDSDPEGNPITAVQVAAPLHGGLALNANGSFTYTPVANYNGPDSFTYMANDGTSNSNTVTVSITVNAVADAPTAVADSYSTNEDVVLNVAAPGVLTNDGDVDGDTITAVLATGVSNGALVLNANGSFSYTPNAQWNGTDGFTYYATDGGLNSATVAVTITVNVVNDAPVAVADVYAATEDTVLNVAAAGVLTNDTDAEGDPLTAVLAVGPTHASAFTLNADGSFSYTPNADYNGSDSFTYRANDGNSNSNVATVTINVANVNDAPVAVADSYSTNEDVVLNVAAPGVLSNDSDVDLDTLTAIKVSDPANGAVTLNADGSFGYTPNADWNGTDSFTYKVNDGTVDGNTVTVTITVHAGNDAPVAVADAYSVNEDAALTVAATGVLANDTDTEGDPLTAALVTGPSHASAFTLNADGGFSYTPASNYNGSDSFVYKANDGAADSNNATVTITINSVNDAPVAVNDTYAATEDTLLTVLVGSGVLANDTDVEGSALTAVLDTNVTHGALTLNADGSFNYTPAADYNGADSFTYHANDGTANSSIATVTINVAAVNDAPVAVADVYAATEDALLTVAAAGVLANDTDVEGSPLTAVLDTNVSNGTLVLNANGGFSYTPNSNFNGADSFTYHANDGVANGNIAAVTINVAPVNDTPVAVADSYTTDEDTVLNPVAPGVLANDSDVDGNPLTAVQDSAPAHAAAFVLNANGSFTYTPALNYNGADSFTYHANDGTANSNVVTVSITVTAVNDAPDAKDDDIAVTENSMVTFDPRADWGHGADSDVEGDALGVTALTSPSHGSVYRVGNNVTYVPFADYEGTDSFGYTVSDGALTDTATVNVIVTADGVTLSHIVNSNLNGTLVPILDATAAALYTAYGVDVYDSTMTDSSIDTAVDSRLVNSTLDNTTMTNSWVFNSDTVQDSTISNSILDNCVVTNSDVDKVFALNCRIEDSTIDPPSGTYDLTGSTIRNGSTVVRSNVTYSTVDGSSITDSTLDHATITNSTLDHVSGSYVVVTDDELVSGTLTWDDGLGHTFTVTGPAYLRTFMNRGPVAGFTASATAITAGGSVSFTDTSSDFNIAPASMPGPGYAPLNDSVTYAWDFGAAGTSTARSPTVVFASAGTYTASQTVTDAYGKSATTTTTITVNAAGGGSSSGGGGSGRRSSDSGVSPSVYTVDSASLRSGYEHRVVSGDVFKFTFKNASQVLRVVKVGTNFVLVDLAGDQRTILNGNTAKFDIDTDRFFDLAVTVKGINYPYATLYLKFVHEAVPDTSVKPIVAPLKPVVTPAPAPDKETVPSGSVDLPDVDIEPIVDKQPTAVVRPAWQKAATGAGIALVIVVFALALYGIGRRLTMNGQLYASAAPVSANGKSNGRKNGKN